MTSTEETLSNLLKEDRRFEPPEELAANANLKEEAYARADADREAFWAEQAERLHWDTKWDQVLDWSNPPFAKWFVGGTLNAAYNCLDRHVENGLGDRVALHWVGEPDDDTRSVTYAELKDEVCKAANALTELGVEKGDRVAIYMPMILETVIAMLACARIGAPHTVVFGGFSADALATRVVDCGVKVIITADGGYRRGAPAALKPAVDEACAKTKSEGHTVDKVLVVRRTGQDVDWNDEVDVWWHDTVDKASSDHECEFFDSEHPLYVMYTSGSTGKPKGILHTTGGYLTGAAYTHWAVFDLKPREQIASAVNLVVHIDRFRDGSRRVANVAEVLHLEGEVISMQDIFRYDYGAQQVVATGIRPQFTDHLMDLGLTVSPAAFEVPRW